MNGKKVDIEEEVEVNVDEVSNDYSDVVVSKEKYDKEKLRKASQLLNENDQNKSTNSIANTTPTTNATSNSTTATTTTPNINNASNELSVNVPISTINLQPTQTRYETLDTDKKGLIF